MDADIRPQLEAAYEENILGLSPSDHVWRVFKLEHLLASIRDRRNVLVSPHLWEDPFENFMAQVKADITQTHLTVSLFGIFGAFYAQCWSLAEGETDATWRIYAPGKIRGARVRSTVGKLFNNIWDWGDPFSALRCFVGRVEYWPEENIREFIAEHGATAALGGKGSTQAMALLIKRPEFAHEHEVRLLYNVIDINQAQGITTRSFACDPDDLFEEIVLDPRLVLDERPEDWRAKLAAVGYTGPIRESALYKIPDLPRILIDY